MRTLRTAAVLFLFLPGFFTVPALRGQTSLSLSPVHLEFVLAAGNSGEGTLSIGNDSPEDVRVRARVVHWTAGLDGTDVFPADGAAPLSAREWIGVVAGDFRIPARETLDMPVLVSVPENVEPGQYPAVIQVESVADRPDEGLRLQSGLTALAVVTVGKPRDEATIEDLAVERRDGRLFLLLRRKNGGRFFVPTEGELVLRDDQGKKTRAAEFADNPIPPLSERVFRIPLTGEIAPGRYEAECILRLRDGKKSSLKKPILIE